MNEVVVVRLNMTPDLQALLGKTRRKPNPKNRVNEVTKEAVLNYAVDDPAHSQNPFFRGIDNCEIDQGALKNQVQHFQGIMLHGKKLRSIEH